MQIYSMLTQAAFFFFFECLLCAGWGAGVSEGNEVRFCPETRGLCAGLASPEPAREAGVPRAARGRQNTLEAGSLKRPLHRLPTHLRDTGFAQISYSSRHKAVKPALVPARRALPLVCSDHRDPLLCRLRAGQALSSGMKDAAPCFPVSAQETSRPGAACSQLKGEGQAADVTRLV